MIMTMIAAILRTAPTSRPKRTIHSKKGLPVFDDFLVRAALAGVGVALAAGPLGCFVVWRRMAYFGDATAHAALLGVALALTFEGPIFLGVLLVALCMALTISTMSGRGLAEDTLLGVTAHSALALGLVAVSLLDGIRIDLMAYLFGDILAVTHLDLALIWGGAAVVTALLIWRWPALLCATLNPDLAQAGGINPRREGLVLTLTLAVTVACAIKVVGALLIAALLIIPAAAARPLARTPEAMAALAALIGSAAALSGLTGAYYWDTPTGPTIVSVAAGGFVLTTLAQRALGKFMQKAAAR